MQDCVTVLRVRLVRRSANASFLLVVAQWLVDQKFRCEVSADDDVTVAESKLFYTCQLANASFLSLVDQNSVAEPGPNDGAIVI